MSNSEVKFYFNNDSIKINNSNYYSNLTVEELNKEVGLYNKVFIGVNDIYTWDFLGVTAYCKNHSKDILEIKFNFLKSDYEFSPKLIFGGQIFVDGFIISNETKIEFLSNNGFAYPTKYKLFLRKESGRFDINAFLNRANTKIEYIAFNIQR